MSLRIKTPISYFHKKRVEIAASVDITTLVEGTWLAPSTVNDEIGKWIVVPAGGANYALPCWLDGIRPDVKAAGTVTVPFGEWEAFTTEFERDTNNFPVGVTAYAPQMPLTAKSGTLVPAAAGEQVHAICVIPPTALTAGTEMYIVRL